MYLKRRVETSDAFIYFSVRSETIRNGVGKGSRWVFLCYINIFIMESTSGLKHKFWA